MIPQSVDLCVEHVVYPASAAHRTHTRSVGPFGKIAPQSVHKSGADAFFELERCSDSLLQKAHTKGSRIKFSSAH